VWSGRSQGFGSGPCSLQIIFAKGEEYRRAGVSSFKEMSQSSLLGLTLRGKLRWGGELGSERGYKVRTGKYLVLLVTSMESRSYTKEESGKRV